MLCLPNFLISLLCFISTFPSKVELAIANIRIAAHFLSQVGKLVYLVAKLGYLFSLQACNRFVESCLESQPPIPVLLPAPQISQSPSSFQSSFPDSSLLDKNGNPLRGAALKARLRKLGIES